MIAVQLKWSAIGLCSLLCGFGCDGGPSQYPARDGSTKADGAIQTDMGGDRTKGKLDGKPAGKDKGWKADKATPPDSAGNPAYTGKPGEFVRQAGGRAYRLFVPAGYKANKAIPLVIGFHGAGDSGSNFYAFCKYTGWTAAAAPANFILLVPDTKSPYKDFAIWSGNPNKDGPQMSKEMGEVLAIVKSTAKEYNVDLKRLHAFGFSDGGLFVGVSGMARAAEFASLAVFGYGWGGAYPIYSPARKIPVQFACGSSDSFNSYAKSSEAFLKGKGHPTRFLTAQGVGHKFSGLMSSHSPGKIFSWMAAYKAP